MTYTRSEILNPPEYRWIRTDQEILASVVMAGDNAAGTVFGTLDPGVILGRQADGRVRPAGRNLLTDDASASNIVEVDDDANFYVGDVVNVKTRDGSIDSVTYAGGDDPTNITLNALGNSRLSVRQLDPSAASQFLRLEITDDGTDVFIAIFLATDGGSAITSTTQDVVDVLVGTGLFLVTSSAATPADLAQAGSLENLIGGVDAGGDIAATRTITVIPKSGTRLITVDGAAFTALTADGAYLALDGAEALPVGVLEASIHTFRNDPATGAQIARDTPTAMGLDGTARESRLTGYSDIQRLLLEGLTDFESAVPLMPGIFINTAL